MNIKMLLLALPFLTVTLAFRTPENLPKTVKLPTVKPMQGITPAFPAIEPAVGQKSSVDQERGKLRSKNADTIAYWYNPSIHTLGNIGFGGAVHAALAPISTKLIDILAYEGQDVRQLVADELSRKVKSSKARVVDLCCGVGISTRALQGAFPHAETMLGVDTSSEMISMARFLSQHLSWVKPTLQSFDRESKGVAYPSTAFATGNAESTKLPSKSFDLVTVMYAFHEVPKKGREKILREAHRLLQPGGVLAVIDVSTDYMPSKSMLAGEPYVLEYQRNIHKQLCTFRGFSIVSYEAIVPDRVGARRPFTHYFLLYLNENPGHATVNT